MQDDNAPTPEKVDEDLDDFTFEGDDTGDWENEEEE